MISAKEAYKLLKDEEPRYLNRVYDETMFDINIGIILNSKDLNNSTIIRSINVKIATRVKDELQKLGYIVKTFSKDDNQGKIFFEIKW